MRLKKEKIVAFFGLILALCVLSCVSQPPAGPRASSSTPFFTGDGSRGKSIAILAPNASGLTEDQSYLPLVVQGELVSNFSGFSAISVLDRQNLDEQYAELLSGYYSDDAEASLDLGHLSPTDYIMGGSITRTASGFALQLRITRTADKITESSYSGTFSFAELDNFTGIRRASMHLLESMGVTLTERGRSELGSAAASNHINAHTTLAQGIVAQQRGTIVEAMVYFHDAVFLDPRLSEASGRLSTLSSSVTSGNIGENVRNDIQRRNEWVRILTGAEDFFSRHLPFEIIYSSTLTQGSIDYSSGTVDLRSTISLSPSTSSFNTIHDILTGLEATGRREEWGLGLWPVIPIPSEGINNDRRRPDLRTELNNAVMYNQPLESKKIFPWLIDDSRRRFMAEERIVVNIILTNEHGNNIAEALVQLRSRIEFAQSTRRSTWDTRDRGIFTVYNFIYDDMRGRSYFYDLTKLVVSEDQKSIIFTDVNASDITDNLTMRIVSVNGIDVAQNPSYIRITAR